MYDLSKFPRTLATDLDLVCDLDTRRRFLGTVMMMGMLLGSLLGGRLGDRIGRKKTMFLGLAFIGPSLFAAAFSRSFEVYAALQLTWCTSMVLIWVNSHACILECFETRSRVPVICIKDLFYPAELGVLGLVGWLLRDWTHLHMASGVLCSLALPIWWLIPESMRWLAQNHRRGEAMEIIREIALVNGRGPLDAAAEEKIDGILARIEEASKIEGRRDKLSFWHMFERRHVVKSLVLLLAWATTNVSSYTLQLNATRLAGNVHLNFILAALSEMPASLLLYLILNRSRRWAGKTRSLKSSVTAVLFYAT